MNKIDTDISTLEIKENSLIVVKLDSELMSDMSTIEGIQKTFSSVFKENKPNAIILGKNIDISLIDEQTMYDMGWVRIDNEKQINKMW